MSPAWLALMTNAGNGGANDSAVGNCFSCEFLARLLGGHDNIAWPIKGKDLPVAVGEQTHCPHDAFDDFDLLVLLLSLPEQGSAPRNNRRSGSTIQHYLAGQHSKANRRACAGRL